MRNDYVYAEIYFSKMERLAASLSAGVALNLHTAGSMVLDSLKGGGTVFWTGNGGSWAQAAHGSAEMTGFFRNRDRRAYRSMVLCSNPSHVSAVANDVVYSYAAQRELEALSTPGDVLIAISTSGRSKSIRDVLARASELRVNSVLLTSILVADGDGSADVTVRIPHSETEWIQVAHLVCVHYICGLVEQLLEEMDA